MSDSIETKNMGRIVQIIGPVLDIVFSKGQVPNIYNALTIVAKNAAGVEMAVTCEVQQLLGDNSVRAVSMNPTEGLMRGMDVVDTGKPLAVPVGKVEVECEVVGFDGRDGEGGVGLGDEAVVFFADATEEVGVGELVAECEGDTVLPFFRLCSRGLLGGHGRLVGGQCGWGLCLGGLG
jgi:hypothetical protein